MNIKSFRQIILLVILLFLYMMQHLKSGLIVVAFVPNGYADFHWIHNSVNQRMAANNYQQYPYHYPSSA